MADHLRGCGLSNADQVIQGHHRAAIGAHIELLHVLRFGAELLIRLYVNAIGAVAEIEVVYVGRAHVDAQSIRNLSQWNVQALSFLAVDGYQILRIAGRKWSVEPDEILARAGLPDDFMRCA